MLTNALCAHLIKYAYFAGILLFATKLKEYKPL